MKHEIHLKYEKCIMSVSYFMVFRENIREIPVKCEIQKVYSRPKFKNILDNIEIIKVGYTPIIFLFHVAFQGTS